MATSTETDIGTLVVRRPGYNGGRPCLVGTGYSIHQLACEYNEGADADEILRQRPNLDLTRIHAGIAYYLANKAWIDAELEEEAAEYQAEVERRRAAREAEASRETHA